MAVGVGAGLPAAAASCLLDPVGAPRPQEAGEWHVVTDGAEGVNFLVESEMVPYMLPVPLEIAVVAIRPALVVLNALPIGEIAVRYGPAATAAAGDGQDCGCAGGGGRVCGTL